MEKLCVCGHDEDAHQHYRRGSDCTQCVAGRCNRYRPATWLRRLIARFG